MIHESRADVDRDIEATLGLVPEFFRQVPDYLISTEWASFKSLDLSDQTAIPNKHHAKAIGLHTASHMTAATRLYERLGFRRAPGFDVEIGEMFTGRSLPAGETWQARAYRLDLGKLQ